MFRRFSQGPWSEGYEKNVYPANFHKMYEIEVAEGKLMEIEFTDFELESSWSGQCIYDYVMVVDAADDDGDGVGDDEDDILLPKKCSDKVLAPFNASQTRSKSILKLMKLFRRMVEDWFIMNYKIILSESKK